MSIRYSLKDLPDDRPLTRDEYLNFDRYMTFANHDKSAKEVNISEAISEIVANLDERMKV